jgi:menaquinone-dependent protoporphyrinogen oxidase
MSPTPKILVVFYSSEGQTERIAQRLAAELRERGDVVDVESVEHAPSVDGYDAVVVGDPIHAVHHSRALTSWLRDHADELRGKTSALFQVSLTSANPDDEHTATAQQLVRELLQRTGFDPDAVGLFAGALLYTRYGWTKRHLMRAIVKREGGDLDMTRDHEYTDWAAVDEFATDVDAIARSRLGS